MPNPSAKTTADEGSGIAEHGFQHGREHDLLQILMLEVPNGKNHELPSNRFSMWDVLNEAKWTNPPSPPDSRDPACALLAKGSAIRAALSSKTES